ncbi:hypothetical protein BBJ28_00020743 [Nothophytophthora sp. Chile5]|nr:hypothetical protein BBJ28_00020743 [Nothophytophthora sp. Chile5]
MVSLSYRGAIATAAVGGLVLLPIAIHLSRSSRRLSVDEKQQKKRSNSTGGRRERRRAARLRSTLPVLENTLDLVRAAGSVHDWMAGACRHFRGRPFVMKAFGLPDMLVVCTPQAFEDVLKTQFQNFPKGPFMCENMRDLLGEGIFAVDGGQWMHQRGIASSLFGMRELRDCMTNAIGRHTVALHDILKRASANNETVDLFKLFNRFSTQAFAEISVGIQMDCLNSDTDHPFQTAFDRAQRSIAQRFVRPRWFWKTQRWLGVGLEGQLQRDIKLIDATVLGIVQKVLAQRTATETKDDTHNDILSLFLNNISKSPDAQEQEYDPIYLRDIVVNFLVAGRDTTAQALSWFFYNVSQNPRIEAKIRKEIYKKLPELMESECTIPTLRQANKLVYLEAAIKETLRLYPSMPMSPKYVVRDTVLSDGTFVAANSMVCLPTYAMGRMPHVWGPDAAEFKPERWIDPSTRKIKSVSAYRFVAFNAGPRMCVGMTLAGLEMKLVAAALLSKFHIHVEKPEDVTYDFSLTLPMKNAMSVTLACA